MTMLSVYRDDQNSQPESVSGYDNIVTRLAEIPVLLERWNTNHDLSDYADQEGILDAYRDAIERLNAKYGFQSIDVVSLKPDHPQKSEFRQKFLAEHTHADFEIRFFVDGKGLFYLHASNKVYLVLCEKGDLISVPANTTHWFDMGENPDFKCIRFFTNDEGWAGNFTGSDIATRYPDFDAFIAQQ